ncbi:hypothetical protein KIPB_010700, partial [Kipferlia bialata]
EYKRLHDQNLEMAAMMHRLLAKLKKKEEKLLAKLKKKEEKEKRANK